MPGRHEVSCPDIEDFFHEDILPCHIRYTPVINPLSEEQTVYVVFCPGDDSYTAIYKTEPSIEHIDVEDDEELLSTIHEDNFKKKLRHGETEVLTGIDRDLEAFTIVITHGGAAYN